MLSVDSCPMEGFKADEIGTMIREEFNIGTDKFGVAAMVAFGYRVDEPRKKARQSLIDIVKCYD